jgi:beta-xylosidase
VQAAKGWIDPCPLWDDDGRVYLVHAWAKSRAGFNSILTVRELSADGTRVLAGDGVNVFDGTARHPTIEGPKFYKRNGYYYIFAPAGGVPTGWQTVLRARNVLGPYEDRIVLQRGTTDINGPHQGGWVDTTSGESWFVHFQDRGAYGRIVHLQPMTWRADDWPVIGADPDGDGIGEPVLDAPKPTVRAAGGASAARRVLVPQTGDEFATSRLGLQWQWEANPSPSWWSLTARPGYLRLIPQPLPAGATPANLWSAPNLLLQKLPAESFEATTAVSLTRVASTDAIALVAMGLDYSLIRLRRTDSAFVVEFVVCRGASEAGVETVVASAVGASQVQLRLSVAAGAMAQFSYSLDGAVFTPLGDRVTLREGRWMGAKFGLVATRESATSSSSAADVDWIRVK